MIRDSIIKPILREYSAKTILKYLRYSFPYKLDLLLNLEDGRKEVIPYGIIKRAYLLFKSKYPEEAKALQYYWLCGEDRHYQARCFYFSYPTFRRRVLDGIYNLMLKVEKRVEREIEIPLIVDNVKPYNTNTIICEFLKYLKSGGLDKKIDCHLFKKEVITYSVVYNAIRNLSLLSPSLYEELDVIVTTRLIYYNRLKVYRAVNIVFNWINNNDCCILPCNNINGVDITWSNKLYESDFRII